jgi:WD40 repeat protein
MPAGSPGRLGNLATSDGQIQATSFSSDGKSLVAAGATGTASSWNTADPAHPVRRTGLTLSSAAVRAVAVSPDQRVVATVAAATGALTVTDMPKLSRTPALATLTGTNAMAFSPDGRTLAVVAGPTSLMLWNVADPSHPALLSKPVGVFGAAVAFSPDGRTLAVAVSGSPTITLWDVANLGLPTRSATLTGHSGAVLSLAFSPDGRTLASGSADDTAVLWDIADRALPLRIASLAGHSSSVTSVAFSPDGRTLAVAGNDDYTVILWDTTFPSAPVRLNTLQTELYAAAGSVTFRGDGRTLAVTEVPTGGPPSIVSWNAAAPVAVTPSVALWDYSALNSVRADPAKYACTVTGRGLTAEEWARYIPEFKYHRTC